MVVDGRLTVRCKQVHIKDLTDFYVAVFDRVLKLDGKFVGGSPYSRYYIISTENLAFKTVQTLIAAELHKRGLLASSELTTVAYEELGLIAKYAFNFVFSSFACQAELTSIRVCQSRGGKYPA